MTEMNIRDQVTDHLITPANSALLLLDYQPTQIFSVNSMDRARLISNIAMLARMAKGFGLPIVLSTVNAKTTDKNDTIPALKCELFGVPAIDRTVINAWEDKNFKDAVVATGRKKLIIAALWTEACLTFPALDALDEGYEVYPVVDAVGGTSHITHETALRRLEQAGAQLTSIAQLACELQRDWTRQQTATLVIGILRELGIFLKLD